MCALKTRLLAQVGHTSGHASGCGTRMPNKMSATIASHVEETLWRRPGWLRPTSPTLVCPNVSMALVRLRRVHVVCARAESACPECMPRGDAANACHECARSLPRLRVQTALPECGSQVRAPVVSVLPNTRFLSQVWDRLFGQLCPPGAGRPGGRTGAAGSGGRRERIWANTGATGAPF